MRLKDQILKEYYKMKLVHPSYQQIASKLGCNKTYVFRVVKQHLANKNRSKGQI
jgi:hypothetical protein